MAEELKGRGLGSLLAAWREGAFDRLREMVLAAKPAPAGHVNLTVKQTPRGWVAAANPRGGGGGLSKFLFIKQTDTNKVQVTFGSVGNEPVDNVLTDATIDASRNIYVKTTIIKDSFGRYIPDPATPPEIVSFLTTATQPVSDGPNETTGEPGSEFYVLLGTVTFDSGEITDVQNTGHGSLGFTPVIVGRVCIEAESEEEEDEIIDVRDIIFYRMQAS